LNDKEFMFFMTFSANRFAMTGCSSSDENSGSVPVAGAPVARAGEQLGLWSEVAV
jgi:hypothetical protein